MNEQDKNNIALLALLRACHKPDTWSSIANQCIIAGNAIKVYRNAIDIRFSRRTMHRSSKERCSTNHPKSNTFHAVLNWKTHGGSQKPNTLIGITADLTF